MKKIKKFILKIGRKILYPSPTKIEKARDYFQKIFKPSYFEGNDYIVKKFLDLKIKVNKNEEDIQEHGGILKKILIKDIALSTHIYIREKIKSGKEESRIENEYGKEEYVKLFNHPGVFAMLSNRNIMIDAQEDYLELLAKMAKKIVKKRIKSI